MGLQQSWDVVATGIHFRRDTVAGDWPTASTVDDGSLLLLHFDAISFAIWKEKLAKRVAGEARLSCRAAHRQRQVERFADVQQDEPALEALFCSLYVLDAASREILLADANLQCIDMSEHSPRINA